jgi:hypothetical protein
MGQGDPSSEHQVLTARSIRSTVREFCFHCRLRLRTGNHSAAALRSARRLAFPFDRGMKLAIERVFIRADR